MLARGRQNHIHHSPWKGSFQSFVKEGLPKNSTESAKLFAAADEPGKPCAFVDARRWRRYQLDVPIRVIVCTPDMTEFYDGRGNELSEGGMTVTAGVELKPGEGMWP